MSDALQRRVDASWAHRIGCDEALLRTPGVHAVAGHDASSQRRVLLLEREATLLVHGEAQLARAIAERLCGGSSLPSRQRLHEVIGVRAGRSIGPVRVLHRQEAPALPRGVGEVRSIAASDRPALARLRSAVTSEEWRHSGLDHDADHRSSVGVFEEGRLLAAASFEMVSGGVARLGVLTHPTARGRRAGRRAVALAARRAADCGLLIQYQTLEENVASLRIALALGFVSDARCLVTAVVDDTTSLASFGSVSDPRIHPVWIRTLRGEDVP